MKNIIVNRLNILLPKIISDNQSRGFMEKRKIMYNIILVQEKIHSSKKKGVKCMVIMLNMAITFDRVRHTFIFYVLRKFGF
jgi:hypothetical protein